MLNVRLLLLVAPLMTTSATIGTAGPSLPVPGTIEPIDPGIDSTRIGLRSLPTVPPEEEPQIGLHEVSWTVPSDGMDLKELAKTWGVRERALRALNPELRGELHAGQKVVVFKPDDEHPTQSVGSPNRGRLRHGIPLPEGSYWTLREHRGHVFGTRNTIEALLKAFNAYGATHPDGPPVPIGDISARRGGRLFPHASHRTGRDVDIGYVMSPEDRGDRYWGHANAENFDVEKNWTLVKALIDTGEVQQIFMSVRLQRLLLPKARQELPDEEVARWFRAANPDYSTPSIIRHWRGHRDHMHVRFVCEDGNDRCRSKSSGARA